MELLLNYLKYIWFINLSPLLSTPEIPQFALHYLASAIGNSKLNIFLKMYKLIHNKFNYTMYVMESEVLNVLFV